MTLGGSGVRNKHDPRGRGGRVRRKRGRRKRGKRRRRRRGDAQAKRGKFESRRREKCVIVRFAEGKKEGRNIE